MHPGAVNKSFVTKGSDSTKAWHKKLGHLSQEGMKKLINISDGMDITARDLKKMKKLCEA